MVAKSCTKGRVRTHYHTFRVLGKLTEVVWYTEYFYLRVTAGRSHQSKLLMFLSHSNHISVHMFQVSQAQAFKYEWIFIGRDYSRGSPLSEIGMSALRSWRLYNSIPLVTHIQGHPSSSWQYWFSSGALGTGIRYDDTFLSLILIYSGFTLCWCLYQLPSVPLQKCTTNRCDCQFRLVGHLNYL